jgi:hypothetical protein
MPMGDTSPTVTATMLSSNNAAAAALSPRLAMTCARLRRLKT